MASTLVQADVIVDKGIKLGAAQPGLKGVFLGPERYAVYLDQPETLGIGLIGGYRDREIRVVADVDCQVAEKFKSGTPDVPEQLFALDEDEAFSCTGGRWSKNRKDWQFFPRDTHVYSLIDHLAVSEDVYGRARRKYGLNESQLFLGKIDSHIFFWTPGRPAKIYCRSLIEKGVDKAINLPRGVIDVMGVTRGTKKAISIVVFREAAGFIHISPYDYGVLEAALPRGEQ